MHRLILFIFYCFFLTNADAQQKIVAGVVRDGHSQEPLSFAGVSFKDKATGKVTDSAGNFHFQFNSFPGDTLIISSIGYEPYLFAIPKGTDSIFASIDMMPAKAEQEMVVVRAKAKHTRGWYLWKKIVAHADSNDIFENDNFNYHVYNRLEIDVNNIDPKKIGNNRLIKPFGKILQSNIDTVTEAKPILPAFFSETISDFYYQKNPHKAREIIEANKISGVKNESVTKFLGALDQNINAYNNFIPVFDKEFTSPFSDKGDDFYDYRLADTQYIGGRRLLHLIFIPKRDGQNTFTGDCWVNDTTFALQKLMLKVDKKGNLNFVDRLSIVQEFKLINDSTWFLSKDKFFADISPLGSNKPGFILRKTTDYTDALANTGSISEELSRNKLPEETIIADGARDKDAVYWDTARTAQLSKTEQGIYRMIDTIQNLPAYKKYYNTIYFLGTGYKEIGKLEIGPWYSWLSSNSLEGQRVRFDLGTNKKFNKDFFVHGYLAYGFKDKRYKNFEELLWIMKKEPRQTLYISHRNDLDYSQNYNAGLQGDNILAIAFRKKGVPVKFINLEETRVQLSRDTKIGLRGVLGVTNKIYNPLMNLPGKEFFPNESFNSTELSFKLRFAYLEKFLETNFSRYSLGSTYPIAEAEFTQSVKGLFGGGYNYKKLKASISDGFSVAPFGRISVGAFAGKIFGTAPYMFLEVHPGNEQYFYNTYAFNLMNRYEFVSDKFAGFSIEHNIGSGLFRFIPITRKLKFRQFWNLKGVTGSLSTANSILNADKAYPLTSLDGKLYLEAGTGVENIFKVLRLDLVWRLLPTPLPTAKASRFGIFGSFKFQL